MLDLDLIRERLKWGHTIDDQEAVLKQFQEDLTEAVQELELNRKAIKELEQLTLENKRIKADYERLRNAILKHRAEYEKAACTDNDWNLWKEVND